MKNKLKLARDGKRRGVSWLLIFMMLVQLVPAGFVAEKVSAATDEKVVFADFEDEAFTGAGWGNRIVQKDEDNGKYKDYIHQGNKALSYTTHGNNQGPNIEIKSVSGSAIDITSMSKIIFYMFDTVGDNNFPLKLIDKGGKSTEIWVEPVVHNTWTKVEVSLSKFDFTDFDPHQVEKIAIWEWNKGTYYIDTIYFANEEESEVLTFQDFEQCRHINNDYLSGIVSNEKRSGNNSLKYGSKIYHKRNCISGLKVFSR